MNQAVHKTGLRRPRDKQPGNNRQLEICEWVFGEIWAKGQIWGTIKLITEVDKISQKKRAQHGAWGTLQGLRRKEGTGGQDRRWSGSSQRAEQGVSGGQQGRVAEGQETSGWGGSTTWQPGDPDLCSKGCFLHGGVGELRETCELRTTLSRGLVATERKENLRDGGRPRRDCGWVCTWENLGPRSASVGGEAEGQPVVMEGGAQRGRVEARPVEGTPWKGEGLGWL